MNQNIVSELPKNSRETIRLRLGEYKGHRFIDLRLFLTLDGQGPVPTKKGVAVPVHLWPQFRQTLARVDAALVEQDWLDREDICPEVKAQDTAPEGQAREEAGKKGV